MKIQIMGHRRLAALLAGTKEKKHDVIMISTPDDFFAIPGSNTIPELARNCLKLPFNDISVVREGYVAPSEDHVRQALEFAKGKDELIVACQAGISRSSAIAYVIKAAEVGPIEALEVLDPDVHQPNLLVIKAAAKVLNRPDMVELMLIWHNKAIEREAERNVHPHNLL